jgi:hypothetical protein
MGNSMIIMSTSSNCCMKLYLSDLLLSVPNAPEAAKSKATNFDKISVLFISKVPCNFNGHICV